MKNFVYPKFDSLVKSWN